MIVTSNLLSKLFKTNNSEIRLFCLNSLKKKITFKYLDKKKEKDLIKKLIKKIAIDSQKVGAKVRKRVWYKGWKETLDLVVKKREKSYLPKYLSLQKNNIFRLNGKFVKSKKNFEIQMLNIYRNWYFQKYFNLVDNIYEFGVGTGHNLIALSKLFPKKVLYGSDFVSPSIKILKKIKKDKNIDLKFFIFDMEKPNKNLKIQKNSAVYTSGAIEQLSGRIENFVNFLIKNKPKIVLHSEPILQFYKSNNQVDALGKIFHLKRSYTSNLYTLLSKYEKEGKINIIKKLKSPFGSLMMEGYSLIVWKPTK